MEGGKWLSTTASEHGPGNHIDPYIAEKLSYFVAIHPTKIIIGQLNGPLFTVIKE